MKFCNLFGKFWFQPQLLFFKPQNFMNFVHKTFWQFVVLKFSLLLQNIENNNNEIKWKKTPPLSRSKTLPDLLYQDHDAPILLFNKESPAPCKIFPKAPKIALTIDDISIGDFQRRKSSGSSVNSNHSTIEPHIYDFQEGERNESSLIIRLACQKFLAIHFLVMWLFHLRIPSYTHLASSVNCENQQKLQNSSNSTFYRFTKLLNNKPAPNVGDERRTSWDKR